MYLIYDLFNDAASSSNYRLIVSNSKIILWRKDPLLGKDIVTNNMTHIACTAVAMQ
jgi:hypothetical protein